MGFRGLIALFVSVIVAVNLYSHVPTGQEEPWKTTMYVAAKKLANTVATVVEKVTRIPALHTIRWLVEAVYGHTSGAYEDLTVQNLLFDGISVRLYSPISAKYPSPCVMYFHGGGWSLFSVDSYEVVAAALARSTNTVVVSVNYRLAPVHPYPIPFFDCVKATVHVLQNGQKYNIDVTRVAVMGDGAGANLAAAVTLRLSEEDPSFTAPLKLQVLIQPALQAFSFDTPSYRQNAEHPLVGRDQMMKFWCWYLGVETTSSVLSSLQRNRHVSPAVRRSVFSTYVDETKLPEYYVKRNYVGSLLDVYSSDFDRELASKMEVKVTDRSVSPLLADDVSKVPRTFVVVAEYDVARDDGLFYASRLKEANVSVEVDYVANQAQGFLAPLLNLRFLEYSSKSRVWQHIYDFVNQELYEN